MRRTIILLFSVFALSTEATCDLDVIVIGAGISGLGAAQELLYHGCRVTVLEARERSGGRIHSVEQGENVVDLGASWIHGIGPGADDEARWKGKYNPLYTITRVENIKTKMTWEDLDESTDNFYWYKSPGTAFDRSKVDTLVEEISEFTEENSYSSPVSYSVDDMLEDFDHGSSADDELVYQFTLNYVFGQEYAAETRDIGAKYVEEVINFDGAEHIFPGGYMQVIEVLAKDVNIQYSQVVNYIDYSGSKVSVRTKSGKVYEGDKVIVTVPLALLQSSAITFNPALASSKTSAINRLGVGLMDKLWLEFDEAFWTDDEDTDWICFVSDTPGVWVETLNIDKHLNIPMLIMFNIGDIAEEYSELSDEDYLATAMQTIRKWYPDAPDYKRYSRSNWSKDEFALGSYSYIKAGASFSDCDEYTEFDSTDEKVFFAGEATMCDMMGAAHAAYISGVDAANFAVKGHAYTQKTFEDRYSREYESSDSSSTALALAASFLLVTI